jgi:choline dehydrogenase-like flavoprotein
LLFRAGAVELYLPVAGSPAVRSQAELDGLLAAARPGRFEIQTVHVMASCPMGSDPARSLVSPAGRLWEARNVFVSDASMLPSNIGESPQGTIMAFAHEIWDRHLAEAPQ